MSRRTPRIARIGRLSLAAPVLLTVALTGCGSGAAAPPVAACSDQTQLTMTRDAAGPTMNWSPASAVSFVAIVQEEASVMACGIRTPMPSLAPPQQANVAPSGAFELASRTLRDGVPYTIIHGVRDTRSTTGAIGERAVASVPCDPQVGTPAPDPHRRDRASHVARPAEPRAPAQSLRSTTPGSARAARRAGITLARRATTPVIATTVA